MINPDPTQTPFPDTSTDRWFKSIRSPAPPPPTKSSKKLLIVACCVIVILFGAVVAVLVFNREPACLDTSDYRALTGTDLADPISPAESFYTDYVLFKDTSATLDPSGEHGDALIEKIANFYQTVHEKSIFIGVKATYFDADAQQRAQERTAAVKSNLLAAGIPSAQISVTYPMYIEPEEPGTTEESEVIITITSAASCR